MRRKSVGLATSSVKIEKLHLEIDMLRGILEENKTLAGKRKVEADIERLETTIETTERRFAVPAFETGNTWLTHCPIPFSREEIRKDLYNKELELDGMFDIEGMVAEEYETEVAPSFTFSTSGSIY